MRQSAPRALGALARRWDDFADAEDACQEALLAAVEQWPRDGVPDNVVGWLVRVGSRRLVDRRRSDRARLERELREAARTPEADQVAPVAAPAHDDSLALFVLCCHPALTPAAQVPLMLRAVAGLTTAQIARGFLVSEATMAQRVSRAKARLREAGATFRSPSADELARRLPTVLQALYLVYTEGHTSTAGTHVQDVALTSEAVRLTRLLVAALRRDGAPADVAAEATGLLALMLLTEARAPARTASDGSIVPLADQDRSLWDRDLVAEGLRLLEETLPAGPVGPYLLQAAVAGVHAEATSWRDTDWLQVTVLYRTLEHVAPSPIVTLNLAVAAAMLHGPQTGLRMTEPLLDEPGLRHSHRVHAVRAHLHEQAGDLASAREAYRRAAALTTSLPEQRYLNARLAALDGR